MAAPNSRVQCVKCGKEKATLKCSGCLQDFCNIHLLEHQQELSAQLDDIEVSRSVFRETLTEQTINPIKHSLIKQIDQWEEDSIRIIQQTAKECRQQILQHSSEYIKNIGVNLVKLTDQLRQTREGNDFNEIELQEFRQKLTQLSEELKKLSNISIQQSSTALVDKICVVTTSQQQLSSHRIDIKTKWTQNGKTIAGGNRKGIQLNQLSRPQGICVDDDEQCIYIADYDNHRIVQWKFGAKTGQIVAGGNGKGDRMDQLNQPTDVIVDKKNNSLIICDSTNMRVVRWPRQDGTNGEILFSDIDCSSLAMDNNGSLYVSDWTKDEVRRWNIKEKKGTIVAGGNGKGDQLNQLNTPIYIFVDDNHSVYVSDCVNNRVMKWMKGAKEGVIVAGGNGQGDSLTQLYNPMGVIVDHLGDVYVADSWNNRIMCWPKGSKTGCIVVGGGNGEGKEANQFNRLRGLSFDRHGNLYVVDWDNNRVQRFDIDPH